MKIRRERLRISLQINLYWCRIVYDDVETERESVPLSICRESWFNGINDWKRWFIVEWWWNFGCKQDLSTREPSSLWKYASLSFWGLCMLIGWILEKSLESLPGVSYQGLYPKGWVYRRRIRIHGWTMWKGGCRCCCPSQLQEFLTSNTSHLKSLLVNTNGYIVKVVFHVFIYNNRFHTANIYELSLFLRYLLVKLPDEVFPFIRGDDVIEEGWIDN